MDGRMKKTAAAGDSRKQACPHFRSEAICIFILMISATIPATARPAKMIQRRLISTVFSLPAVPAMPLPVLPILPVMPLPLLPILPVMPLPLLPILPAMPLPVLPMFFAVP